LKPNLGFGVSYAAQVEGMATGFAVSVCVPTPKFRHGGGAFTTTCFGLEDASSGKTPLRKYATVYIRFLLPILACNILLQNLTHFSCGCCFSRFRVSFFFFDGVASGNVSAETRGAGFFGESGKFSGETSYIIRFFLYRK